MNYNYKLMNPISITLVRVCFTIAAFLVGANVAKAQDQDIMDTALGSPEFDRAVPSASNVQLAEIGVGGPIVLIGVDILYAASPLGVIMATPVQEAPGIVADVKYALKHRQIKPWKTSATRSRWHDFYSHETPVEFTAKQLKRGYQFNGKLLKDAAESDVELLRRASTKMEKGVHDLTRYIKRDFSQSFKSSLSAH